MVLPFISEITDHRLLNWLAEHTTDDPQLSWNLRLAEWTNNSSLELYQRISQLAEQLERTDNWQQLLIDQISPYKVHVLAHIHLYNENWGKAWRLVHSKKQASA